ncbi:TlpA family protein disulfide reductase [Candidatus Bipolaricaulota bacterium]
MRHKAWKIALPTAIGIGLLIGGLIAFQPFAAQSEQPEQDEMIVLPDWASTELYDVVTGELFRISDFAGKPILIESFAVWCSTCLRQQKEMARLIELAGDAIVHVSLDTDPNEDIDKVLSHTQRHEFEWLFSVAPIEMTQALIDEFGLTVVNAPRAPVILIDADGNARLLPNGVKTAEELLEEIGELPESPAEDGENP